MKNNNQTMKEFGFALVKSAMVTTALGRADHNVNTSLSFDEMTKSIKVR